MNWLTLEEIATQCEGRSPNTIKVWLIGKEFKKFPYKGRVYPPDVVQFAIEKHKTACYKNIRHPDVEKKFYRPSKYHAKDIDEVKLEELRQLRAEIIKIQPTVLRVVGLIKKGELATPDEVRDELKNVLSKLSSMICIIGWQKGGKQTPSTILNEIPALIDEVCMSTNWQKDQLEEVIKTTFPDNNQEKIMKFLKNLR